MRALEFVQRSASTAISPKGPFGDFDGGAFAFRHSAELLAKWSEAVGELVRWSDVPPVRNQAPDARRARAIPADVEAGSEMEWMEWQLDNPTNNSNRQLRVINCRMRSEFCFFVPLNCSCLELHRRELQ